MQTDIPKINPEKSLEVISEFMKKIVESSESEGLVVGLSGGIDSTVAVYIASRTLDKDKILGLIMPSSTTAPEDVEDALLVAENLGIQNKIINIDNLIEKFSEACEYHGPEDLYKLAEANLKARTRMIILYYHANTMNRLVLGTGNQSELLVGYFTKYGDGGVDLLPIGDLYKSDVQELARYLEIPHKILRKPPTAGLWPGQTDEKELGIKYSLLDKILYYLVDENLPAKQVAEKLEISEKEVLRIKKMMASAEHKLTSPPVPKIRRT